MGSQFFSHSPVKMIKQYAVATYDAAGAECPEKTTLSMLRFLNLDLSVMVKWMEVTMLTLRLNVKHSTFAQLMELEVWPSTASSVLMVHSSTRTTSSVTGGLTLTAPLPRIFTLSMMKLLLSVKLLQEHLMRVLVPMRHQLTMLLLQHLLATTLLVLMKDLEALKQKKQQARRKESRKERKLQRINPDTGKNPE